MASKARVSRAASAEAAKAGHRPRDAAATTERILQSAIAEFAENGYAGARIDAIARGAKANMRMLYHYFGSKDALYIRVLETVFNDIRVQEQRLKLNNLAPLEAMIKLFDFTFSHFAANPLFVRILASEDLLGARFLTLSKHVSTLSSPLLLAIKEVLSRGEAEGVFRRGIDPLQLYVSMVAMSYVHISNAPTLSHLFGTNLSSPSWRTQRRRHTTEMMIAFLGFVPSRLVERNRPRRVWRVRVDGGFLRKAKPTLIGVFSLALPVPPMLIAVLLKYFPDSCVGNF